MSTPSIETGIRAHLLARTWTWIVSVVLTLSAIAAGYGGGSALCHWGGGTELPGFMSPPIALFGSSLTFDSYVAMTSSILVWTVAWALHFHASRRRRMSIFHVIVPMTIFLPWLIVALRTAPTCTSL